MNTFDLSKALGEPKLDKYLEKVEQHIAVAIGSGNPHISRPLARLLVKPGKRLRPALTVTIAKNLGAPIDKKVITAATAVELVHIGSLIHDDIIDHAKTRWNTPTINAREGVDHAIIIGDFMLAKACQLAATVSAEVAEVIASAIVALCDGQSLEVSEEFNTERTIDSALQSITGKTAALMSASCKIGGLCAGSEARDLKHLADFGKNFGLSFQLIDDVLDFIADPKRLGKAVGNDVKEGVYTMPVTLTLTGSDSDAIQALLVQKSSVDINSLISLIIKHKSFTKVIAEAKIYNHAASKSLGLMRESQNLKPLHEFPETYMNWAIDYLMAEKYRTQVFN